MAEVITPSSRKSPTQLLEYTSQEYAYLYQLQAKTLDDHRRTDQTELDGMSKKFEEAIHREKARVDADLLRLTAVFTKMVHNTRNKVFNYLDEQLIIYTDNLEFLRETIRNSHKKLPSLPEFDKGDFQTRVNEAPEYQKLAMIEEKLSEILTTRRVFERNQREKRHNATLIETALKGPQEVQQRSERAHGEFYNNFETTLTNILNDYKPKNLKYFRHERNVASHLEVNLDNYFEDKVTPKVHYFEPETKVLHSITLPVGDQINKNVPLPEKTTSLEIEFSIPAYHGSITTPSGRVFLVGGLDSNEDSQGTHRCYELDFNTSILNRKANMLTRRYGFAITYAKGKIYVFGGINGSGVLASCEEYDVQTNKWNSIPDLAAPSAHANVCNYRDLFIYKFGGYGKDQGHNPLIERYNLSTKLWATIKPQVNGTHFVYPLSASSLINANEILVFGGIKEDRQGTNVSFVLTIDKEDVGDNKLYYEGITSIGEADLPFADGFWNPQTIVHQNVLYAIQNVSGEGSVLGARLLVYRDRAWEFMKA